jgi:hypothetical protein
MGTSYETLLLVFQPTPSHCFPFGRHELLRLQ